MYMSKVAYRYRSEHLEERFQAFQGDFRGDQGLALSSSSPMLRY